MYKPAKNKSVAAENWRVSTLVLLAGLPCLVVVAVVALGCNFIITSGFSFTGEKSQKAESGEIAADVSTIEIINKHGRVDISHQPDTNWAWDLTTWADSKEEAELIQEKITMRVTETDGKQTWELILPDDMSDCNGIKSDLVIYVPKTVEAIVKNIHGDVEVHELEGGIDISNAHGNVACVSVPCNVEIENRHGNISLNEFSNAKLNNQHGDLTISGSTGDVVVEARHGDIVISNLGGALDLESAHGNIKSAEISGNVDIENQHGDISLICSGETVKCENKHGDVEITINNVSAKSVEVYSRHGEIVVSLPDSTNPNISASASHGDVRNEFDSSSAGDLVVQLETTHDDIRIRKHTVTESATVSGGMKKD